MALVGKPCLLHQTNDRIRGRAVPMDHHGLLAPVGKLAIVSSCSSSSLPTVTGSYLVVSHSQLHLYDHHVVFVIRLVSLHELSEFSGILKVVRVCCNHTFCQYRYYRYEFLTGDRLF